MKHPGTYTLKEVLKDKWTETSPVLTYSPGDGSTPSVLGYDSITVSSGTDVTGKDFENFEWATVAGTKTEYGGSGLSGWTIKAVDGLKVYSDDTDSFGDFLITVKEPGTYDIKEVLKAGWTMTSPSLHVGSGSDEEVTGYAGVSIGSGDAITDKDFENFKWLTISGYKHDTEGVALESWDMELYDSNGLYASDTTDSIGYYKFTVKAPGTYSIKEVLPSGWTEVSPEHHYGDGSSVLGYSGITVSSGVDVTDKDFVNFEWLTVSGVKYEDTDGTHPTTSPLSGWTIKLYKDPDTITPYATATTADTTGTYSFTVKDPGTYHLKEVLPTGWTATSPTYQVGPASGSIEVEGYSFDAESGVNVPNQDFWNFEWITVSGYKFFDANGNTVKDTGEPGLEHWKIALYKGAVKIDEDETDGNGYYEFPDAIKEPGTYTVSETLLGTCLPWTATTPATVTFPAVSGHDETVDFGNWLGKSIVTTSSYCWFDVEPGGAQQFKLIFTPDVPDNPSLFRLTASNPGQFYYNVFYVGTLSEGDTFTITLPYPFVTQGANPVHVYSSLNTNPDGCLIPQGDISDGFSVFKTMITIADYTDTNGDGHVGFGDEVTITVTYTDTTSYTGLAYITVHLDYGLKKTIGGLGKDGTSNAILPGPDKTFGTGDDIIAIQNHGNYVFSVDGPVIDTQTVQNLNVFKRDPGFGGLVTDSTGTPVKGVRVQIYGPDGRLIATVYTDEDGWYQYNYKYTGKPATFTIKLPDYGLQKSVTLKANTFVVVNFQIP